MQLTQELVYCIICRQLVPKGETYRVFKTGFFKREFPLAQCTYCLDIATRDQNVTSSGM